MYHSKTFDAYTKELSNPKYSPLSVDEERRQLAAYASGSTEAFDRLVNAHLRFVVYFLRDYKIPDTVDVMDVIQEANMGLMEGIRRFDNSHDCRVFSYCFFWIRSHVIKVFDVNVKSSNLFQSLEATDEGYATANPLDGVAVEKSVKDIVETQFSMLDTREKKIMSLFFGLEYPYQPKSLEEVGSMLHLSHEAIRKIKKTALEKLHKKNLKKMLDT